MAILTEVYSNGVLNTDSYTQKLICLISILEGYLSKVSEDYFESVNITNLREVTLNKLGIIYNTYLCKNDGLNGVCWEYAVFNSIYYNDEYVQWLINTAINYLTGENGSERLNAILWGGEKSNLDIENIKKNITDFDTIWTPNGDCNFKEHIDLIYNSFHQRKLRKLLPQHIKNIWKTDLFVKKESKNQWQTITVKWNKNELKRYAGLSIGVCYEPITYMQKKNYINPSIQEIIFNRATFIRCCIPYAFNFGEYYSYMFRFTKQMLLEINSKITNAKYLKFARNEEITLFLQLHKWRDVSCIELIDYLKSKYNYYTNITEKKGIVSNNEQIIFNPFDSIETKEDKSIIFLPK